MNEPVIEVSGVHKRYGEVLALEDVGLQVPPAQLFGLIGHNGAGKSTLIKLMLGLIEADRGSVAVLGQPVASPAFRQARRAIGYLPENVSFYDNLSGEETLRFYADLKGVGAEACQRLLGELGLAHAARRQVRTYSKGMRQRLGFAQALLGAPRVLFLDEPASGLDPEGVRELYDMLAALKAQGVTILLSSHNLAQIQDRVDGVALLQGGRLRAVGTVSALRAALHLPVRLRVHVGASARERLEAIVAAVPGCVLVASRDGEVVIDCPRAAKMAVLAKLLDGGLALHDLTVQEPSLEEVFLGYAGAAPVAYSHV